VDKDQVTKEKRRGERKTRGEPVLRINKAFYPLTWGSKGGVRVGSTKEKWIKLDGGRETAQ